MEHKFHGILNLLGVSVVSPFILKIYKIACKTTFFCYFHILHRPDQVDSEQLVGWYSEVTRFTPGEGAGKEWSCVQGEFMKTRTLDRMVKCLCW